MRTRAPEATSRTVRRGFVRRLLRTAAWSGGSILVRVLSAARRFDLPEDDLLPLYQLRMLLGLYEAETVAVCRRLVPRGATVVDVGAHAGYFTLLLARLVGPAGLVFAFEPHPRNFAALARNVRRRGLAHVTLVEKAVADRDGQLPFFETPLSMGHSLFAAKPGARPTTVEAVSLDAFARTAGVAEVALIKMDVEGGEPSVLAGMRYLLGRSPHLSIILEFKPSVLRLAGHDPAALLRQLAASGLAVSVIARGGTSQPVRPGEEEALTASVVQCNLLATKVT